MARLLVVWSEGCKRFSSFGARAGWPFSVGNFPSKLAAFLGPQPRNGSIFTSCQCSVFTVSQALFGREQRQLLYEKGFHSFIPGYEKRHQ